jgi:hypothetical protein
MMVADPESRTRYLSRYERGMIYKYPFHSPANSKDQSENRERYFWPSTLSTGLLSYCA